MKADRRVFPRWCRVLAVVSVLGLAGCSVLPDPAPPPTQYRLAGASEAFESAPGGPVLLVSAGAADAGFATTAMRYTRDGPALLTYADGEWVSPPQVMVEEAALQALGASGRYRAVVAETDAVRADLRLTLQLGELIHDRASGELRLSLRAVLVDATGRVQLSDVYSAVVPAGGDGPGAMAMAGQSALREVLRRLVGRLVQIDAMADGRSGN